MSREIEITKPKKKNRFYEKGGRQNGFGRAAGIPNKATGDMKKDLTNFCTDPYYQDNLRDRIFAGQAPGMEKYIWESWLGKAATVVAIKDERPNTGALSETLKALSKAEQKEFWDLLMKASAVQAARADAVETAPKALPPAKK